MQEKADRDAKIKIFYEKTMGESQDLGDQLQELTTFLQEFTAATAVYVGKLVQPKKKIKEDDDDKAHFDLDSPQIIKFLNATEEHKYLVDAVLKPDQGLTFDVFKDEAEPVVDSEEQPPEEEQQPFKVKFKEVTENLPRSIFVKEVVREPRMHFYKVPRLGSYLAIRLEYQSCMSEESLDAAVQDYLEVKHKKKEQDDEKRSFMEKNQSTIEDRENDDHSLDSSVVHTQRKWEEIKHKPFKTQKVQFVVCLNTLGQDREFTPDEIKFAQRTVRDYAAQWELIEKRNLEQDVLQRLVSIQSDLEYKKEREVPDNQELEKKIEEAIAPKEGEDPLEEEAKVST